MMGSRKIKAGALQFVLLIGAVIAVILMAFVLLSQTHALFEKKTDLTVELIQTVDKVMFQSFVPKMGPGQRWKPLKENDLGIQTTVQKGYWGVLEKRSATARKGKLQFTKTGFVGHGEEGRYALYLKDDQRPMVIAGDAKIIGDALLPQRGIKMGNIQGFGYTRPRLVYGKIKQSNASLPKLNEGMQWQLEKLTDPVHVPKGERQGLERGLALTNSFLDEPKVISGGFVDLAEVSLRGNIVIWATDSIRVHRSATLGDVVLIAPQIEVADGFSGNFQAMAWERIVVGRDCTLDYPTVLAVQRPTTIDRSTVMEQEPRIMVDRGSSVSGMVLFIDQNTYRGIGPYIKIEQGATIRGEVHCTQYLELGGKVLGSVTTKAFVARDNGNVYLNHLYHGSMDASVLPMEYGGIRYENENANRIMKWLY